METLTKTNGLEISVIADKIKSGLEVFESRKQDLQGLAEKAHGLKIESLEDTESIKQVSTIRKTLKSARVSIEKEGKSMRDPLTAISKHISAKEKELVLIIEPTERELQAQEKWVEDEKEKIRLEEEAKETARVQARIDALAQYGFTIDYDLIKNASDTDFERMLQAGKGEWEREQAEKAAAEKLRLEQEAREKADREAEAERLKKERAELEELRRQQAEAQRKIDEQNAAIEAEKKRMQDEKDAIERAKQREIEEKQRAESLQKAREEAAEQARLKAIEDARIAEEKRKEDELKAKQAAEKKAARQPDKVKLLAFAAKLDNLIDFDVKSEEAKGIVENIKTMIGKMKTFITEKSESL